MRIEQTRGLAPGTRLRCVKPASHGHAYVSQLKPLTVGEIYTILSMKRALVVLEEITNFAADHMHERVAHEYAYGYDCFEVAEDWDE